jgi:hypothetical protein
LHIPLHPNLSPPSFSIIKLFREVWMFPTNEWQCIMLHGTSWSPSFPMHCLIYVVMLTFEPFIMFFLFIFLFFGIQAPSHLPHLQDVIPIWFVATSL